jgi:hypothetical protein
VLTRSRLTDAELLGNQQPADPIAHQVTIHLRAEMSPRILEPLEDLKPALVGQSPNSLFYRHIANLLITDMLVNSRLLTITARMRCLTLPKW